MGGFTCPQWWFWEGEDFEGSGAKIISYFGDVICSPVKRIIKLYTIEN